MRIYEMNASGDIVTKNTKTEQEVYELKERLDSIERFLKNAFGVGRKNTAKKVAKK